MLKDFKAFIFRGNIVDIAVGIVVGTAFNQMIQAFVKDFLTPIIGIFGKVSFSSIHFTINNSVFAVGDLLNFVFSFIIISATVFFIIVSPMSKLTKKFVSERDPETKNCTFCISEIPVAATRCPQCTSQLEGVIG